GSPATVGSYSESVTFRDKSGSPSHQLFFNLKVTDFSLSATSAQATVSAGQTAKFALNVRGVGGAFSHAVSFSCSGLPASSTCSFSPQSVTPGNGVSAVTMSVTTAARLASSPQGNHAAPVYAMWLLPVSGMVLIFAGPERGRGSAKRRAGFVILVITVLLVLGLVSC